MKPHAQIQKHPNACLNDTPGKSLCRQALSPSTTTALFISLSLFLHLSRSISPSLHLSFAVLFSLHILSLTSSLYMYFSRPFSTSLFPSFVALSSHLSLSLFPALSYHLYRSYLQVSSPYANVEKRFSEQTPRVVPLDSTHHTAILCTPV